MPNAQINPKFIQLLLNQEVSTIPNFPTIEDLPGSYVKTIFKNKKALPAILAENHQMLTCKTCGKKGKYDVGMLVVNVDEEKNENVSDTLQMTGYFRCKHCNDAGNWELPSSLFFSAITSILPFGNTNQKRGMVGQNLLFDGSWHRYSTDAEEHLLNILENNPLDSFVWNRLGNLYQKGNRPELAVSAFEHSILIDPGQTESHFTLGYMLVQIDDFPNAGYHFRQMLLSAESYKKLPAENLREMLASGLQLLFFMHQDTNGEVPFIPTLNEIEAYGRIKDSSRQNLTEVNLEVHPDDIESFFPIAEMYMGTRSMEIPLKKRTLQIMNAANSSVKRKKVKKRKRRK